MNSPNPYPSNRTQLLHDLLLTHPPQILRIQSTIMEPRSQLDNVLDFPTAQSRAS